MSRPPPRSVRPVAAATTARAATVVSAGAVVTFPSVQAAPPPAPVDADALGFAVPYEDEHLLVIDKPAGVAVHGASGVSFGVIEQLRRARPEAKFL